MRETLKRTSRQLFHSIAHHGSGPARTDAPEQIMRKTHDRSTDYTRHLHTTLKSDSFDEDATREFRQQGVCWNPGSVRSGVLEDAVLKFKGEVVPILTRRASACLASQTRIAKGKRRQLRKCHGGNGVAGKNPWDDVTPVCSMQYAKVFSGKEFQRDEATLVLMAFV